MPSAESSNKFLLIKIKFQVLKLLECIEKLSEFEQKDAVHFILYRISRIRRSKVKESLDFWGKLTSGHFGRKRKSLGKKDWTKDRQLLRLKRPENVSGLVSYWLLRKTFENFQRNSQVFRKFLHLNTWDLLHRSICGDFTRRIFENPLLDISLNDEDDEEVDELEYLMHDSDSPPQLAVKTEKMKAKKIPKRAKVPKKVVFPCFHCPKSYKRRQNVVDHYAAKHRGFCPDCGDEIGLNAQGKVLHNRSKHLEEYPFVCEICGESMSRNQQYQNHIAVHSRKSLMPVKPPSPKKPKVEKPPKINRYAIVLPDGVICPVCGLKFRNPSLLNAHRARHHAKSTFQCEICSEVFKFRTSYTRHKRIHTVQEKKFTCETCGLKYMTNSALKDHLKLTHERVDISCEVCGKTFAIQRFLRRHMKMHSNERPFACDLCPLTFKIRHHLDRHRKTVHRDILFGSGSGGGKKLPEKVTEIAKIDEIVDKNAIESNKEAFKDLPVATESTLLQMISDQIPPEVIPLANSEPVQPQCCSGEFPLPAEIIQSYQENYTTYPESYSIPQETYLPAPDYSINPQEILEIPPGLPPENMDTQLLDPSFIPPYPYNMWDNQFDCQNTMNQQAMPQNPQATYNIGSILSNLELMENNATFDPGYDFFESTPQQQFYGNGTSCPDTEILQWQQKIDQYDFNSQNHTLTDISNTFLREEQRQSSNLSSYVNNFGTGMGGEEQQVFNANNVNVMLPSLADYLQNHLNPFNTSHEDVEQQ